MKNMNPIEVTSTDDKIVITIERASLELSVLVDLLNRLRIEQLVQKANFSEQLTDIGEQIKKEWWEKNKDRYLNNE
jgi:hypothetical protein